MSSRETQVWSTENLTTANVPLLVMAATTALLNRLTPEQRIDFQLFWDEIPPRMQHIPFELSGDSWTPAVIDEVKPPRMNILHAFSRLPLTSVNDHNSVENHNARRDPAYRHMSRRNTRVLDS